MERSQIRRGTEQTTASLHIIAMVLMLWDHIGAILLPDLAWMRIPGRLAFPIFCFLVTEAVDHTRDLRAYTYRLLLAAILSEVPYDLAFYGTWFYPGSQNTIFTLWIAATLLRAHRTLRESGNQWLREGASLVIPTLGLVIGAVARVDYSGFGVLTIFCFYGLREDSRPFQAVRLGIFALLHILFLGSPVPMEVPLLGRAVVNIQAFALISLIPIALYRGERGYHTRRFQMFCYLFYPCHLLALAALHTTLA